MNQPNPSEGFVRRFFSKLGPGLITGAADDDPSGIATYSVTGATFGYGPLWTALFSFPLMVAVQLMCARLGMVTGRGLAAVIRRRFGLAGAAFIDIARGTGQEMDWDYAVIDATTEAPAMLTAL